MHVGNNRLCPVAASNRASVNYTLYIVHTSKENELNYSPFKSFNTEPAYCSLFPSESSNCIMYKPVNIMHKDLMDSFLSSIFFGQGTKLEHILVQMY